MAKVITVSQKFPSSHPKAGQPTHFVEKIWHSMAPLDTTVSELNKNIENNTIKQFLENLEFIDYFPKNHTVRLGRRWKTGDMASIRTWGTDINPKSKRSGPYHSKQIIIAPDVEVTVYNIKIDCWKWGIQPTMPTEIEDEFDLLSAGEIAENDGLSLDDFMYWFNPKGKKQEIEAQIICWNKSVKY